MFQVFTEAHKIFIVLWEIFYYSRHSLYLGCVGPVVVVCRLSCSSACRILVPLCCCSVAQSCLNLCDPMDCSTQTSLSLTIFWSLPKFMSMASMMPSSHLILWWPLFLLFSIFHSIRDISSESAVLIRWPKYWSFSFSISPSNEYSGVFPLRLIGLISLLFKGLSGVFSSTTVQSH